MFPFLVYRDESLPTYLDGTASQSVSIIKLFMVLIITYRFALCPYCTDFRQHSCRKIFRLQLLGHR